MHSNFVFMMNASNFFLFFSLYVETSWYTCTHHHWSFYRLWYGYTSHSNVCIPPYYAETMQKAKAQC